MRGDVRSHLNLPLSWFLDSHPSHDLLSMLSVARATTTLPTSKIKNTSFQKNWWQSLKFFGEHKWLRGVVLLPRALVVRALRWPGGTRSPTGVNPACGLSNAGRLECARCEGLENHGNCKGSSREANEVRLGASATAGAGGPRESPFVFCKNTEGWQLARGCKCVLFIMYFFNGIWCTH